MGEVSPQIRELLLAGDLPTITLNYDSADIVQRIESMTVKIQPYDVGKRELISRVYRRHLTPLARASASQPRFSLRVLPLPLPFLYLFGEESAPLTPREECAKIIPIF